MANKFKEFLNCPEYSRLKDGNYLPSCPLRWRDVEGVEHIIQPEPFDGHSIPERLKRFFIKVDKRLRPAQLHDDVFIHREDYGWTLEDANDSYLAAGLWVCTNEGFSTRELMEWLAARAGLWIGSWWPWVFHRVK